MYTGYTDTTSCIFLTQVCFGLNMSETAASDNKNPTLPYLLWLTLLFSKYTTKFMSYNEEMNSLGLLSFRRRQETSSVK